MTDDEAFARLGEVMAEVGKPWPRYSRDEIMRMQWCEYMYYRLMNQPTWRGYEWYSSLTHTTDNATHPHHQH